MLRLILLVSVWLCVNGRYYYQENERDMNYDEYNNNRRQNYYDPQHEHFKRNSEQGVYDDNEWLRSSDSDYNSKREKIYNLVRDLLDYSKNKRSTGDEKLTDIGSLGNAISNEKVKLPEAKPSENIDQVSNLEQNFVEEKPVSTTTEELRMPGVSPKEPDTYLCYAYKLPEDDRYITEFNPVADMKTAHHMLLFGCKTPFKEAKPWQCREMQPVCSSGGQSIKYAWGRNAPSLKMPENVAFHVGGETGINYLVVQVHYLNVTKFKDGKTKDKSGLKFTMTSKRPKYFAGIYFLGAGWPAIPPHVERFHMDMKCLYSGDVTFYPFRFRVHAHKLGAVITAYRVRDGKWSLIGRGDPQRAQAFYKVFNDVNVKKGDYLMGRCTFNSTSRDTKTFIGATHSDEMCNFYTMYFYDADKYGNVGDLPCAGVFNKTLQYPKTSDVTLGEVEKANSLLIHSSAYNQVEGWPAGGESDGDVDRTKIPLLGQVAGVDFTVGDDKIVFFHRASLKWGYDTFDLRNVLNPTLQKHPIPEDVLVWLDAKTGKVLKTAGANRFHVPHGVTVDHENNIWVTDVGAHQVSKLSPEGDELLVVGEKFVNGKDDKHFCKPADVAVAANGDFFVADGYCNDRVVKFNAKGEFLMEMGSERLVDLSPNTMSVVHSIALDEAKKRVYVADRENKRVLVFHSNTGEYLTQISNRFDGPVYAIAFNPRNGGELHVVNEVYDQEEGAVKKTTSGFTYSLKLHRIVSKWKPKTGFHKPHDVAVSKDNQNIVATEIGPNRIWKFHHMRTEVNDPVSRP